MKIRQGRSRDARRRLGSEAGARDRNAEGGLKDGALPSRKTRTGGSAGRDGEDASVLVALLWDFHNAKNNGLAYPV